MKRRSLIGSAAACFATAIAAVLTDGALSIVHAQTKLDATYQATLLGIPVAHISWTVDLADNQFTAAASGTTSGLMRVFSSGSGAVSAHGTVAAGRPVVSNYALNFIAGRWSDDVRISYSGGKATEHLPNPPPAPNPNRVPLTEAQRVGVIDPMMATLVRVPGNGEVIGPQACDRTIAVFDGHTRYDLRLAFKRLDNVKADKGYQGPVVVCSVDFAPVAGYDPERFLTKYLAAQRDIEVWLAPVAASRLLVPFRISMPTPMGQGVVQATRFETPQ